MNKLNRFVSISEELCGLAGQESKPAIAVIGSYNSGKSTLVNQLLGEEISPVSAVPTTNCLLHFDYGKSFAAKYTGAKGQRVFTDRAALRSFLAEQLPPGGRVSIELPAPLLKKCRLLDTPGIDSFAACETTRLVEQAINESTKIIYLFHQRGIENFNRQFLYKLASIWKNKNLNDVYFWLNCNLGSCDGTSLDTTSVMLRKILLRPVKLNAINILDDENIQALRLFIEVTLAQYYFHHLDKNLNRIDGEIAAKIKKITGITDESLFLSEFWAVWETTEKLFTAYRTIKSMPTVVRESEDLLHLINARNVSKAARRTGGQLYRPHAGGLKEGKELILAIIDAIKNEKQLEGWLERSNLNKLAQRVAQERFTVVAAGNFSTGKSTFFNALLKEEILPTGNGPTTTSITRIAYGQKKTATVRLPLQITLQICEEIEKYHYLCADKLDILENCLNSDKHGLAYLEAYVDGHFKLVDQREMHTLIKQTKEYYAVNVINGTGRNLPVPDVFKPIPAIRSARKKILQKVRLTFHYSDNPVFDLTNPAEIKQFSEVTDAGNAFRIAGIDLRHPSEYLKLADFIDTPGLDSVEKHNFADLAENIRRCDAYLIFLNARHILHNIEQENLKPILGPQISAGFKSQQIPDKALENIYFVINFSDILTPSQQEAVVNFVRKHLHVPAPHFRATPGAKIFLISALRGLAGKDRGMKALLENLEEGVMRHRGRDFYVNILNELNAMLESAAQKINSESLNMLQNGLRAGEIKQKMRLALEKIRESRREIKKVKKTIYDLGRL